MKARDIIHALEEFAPGGIQEKWDNSGLIVGSPERDVNGVLLGFDCTPELVDEAVARGADMIVTHHPLIFGGISRITEDDFVGRTIIKAVSAGISVYAAHTNADKVLNGVSGAMASRLGLRNVRILDIDSSASAGLTDNVYGLGVIGECGTPLTAAQAVEYVKSKFGLKMLRYSRPVEGMISKIAVCGGSGSSLIGKARSEGAQLFITGDVSYHHFFTGDDFMIMDIGHFESEIDIVEILFTILSKKFPNFAFLISDSLKYSNPIYYF